MTESTGKSRIGVTGLAVMGANLARNIARHGVADRRAQPHDGEDDASSSRTTATRARSPACESLEDFVARAGDARGGSS